MSKYGALWKYVSEKNEDKLTVSFEDINNICGFSIDHSFLTYKKELASYGFAVKKISQKTRPLLLKWRRRCADEERNDIGKRRDVYANRSDGGAYLYRAAFGMFFCFYTFAGITDVLDGFIARRTNTESDKGARLDSIADLMFYTVMIIRLFPVLYKVLPKKYGLLPAEQCLYAYAPM